ncbi:M48 family metalloprotease [Allokutzneria sp. NRRL B-24872]|uniref:M48 family metalloprotease n=1 Tax=Allokutzneria sp. NRRL B-24872 TaxID=1137961 RepID=UPI00143DF348|nr:M48 family metalloprotease [Allokutzneria sp. NRRL B-24872]
MITAAEPVPVEERVMGVGTTVRFALLMVLVIAASGALMSVVLEGLSGAGSRVCELAGGADPDAGILQIKLALMDQFAQVEECGRRFSPGLPWWSAAAWPVAVLVGAVVVFLALPAWRLRSRRVVPLDVADRSGAILRVVEAASATAGLRRAPKVVVEPLARSAAAVAFGSNRRPVVCLSGGLVVCATTRPEYFRAVLLHELAHIRHGDITLTYATVALWRVFVGLVLLPYTVWMAVSLFDGTVWSSDTAFMVRGVLLAALLVPLVHLAKLDVLRSREVHADVAATRWGAERSAWAEEPAGRPRRLVAAFPELWRTHPRVDLRRAALADSGALFGVRALPVFLTGVAAILVNAQLESYVVPFLPRDSAVLGWLKQLLPLIPAGLAVGAVGFALWRAVEHAARTSRPAPSGALTGLWLGFGLAFGELFLHRTAVTEWMPAHPEALLLVVAAGVVVAWWIEQCARLWTASRRGPASRLVMVAALGAAWLAMASWLVWWRGDGVLLASGWPYGTTEIQSAFTAGLGQGASGYGPLLWAFSTVFPVLAGISEPVLLLTAVGALWLVPLAAWASRQPDGTPRWLQSSLDGTGAVLVGSTGVPPLRQVLLPGLLGGALACVMIVGWQAYLHTWLPVPSGTGALFVLTYLAGIFLALVAGTAVAAVASTRVRAFRLVVALIAAETAAVVGFAGALVLTSVDGCVPPLRTVEPTCGVHSTVTELAFTLVLTPLVVSAALIAIAVAALAGLSKRAPALPLPLNPRELPTRRRAVAVLCVAAVVVAGTGVVQASRDSGNSGVANVFARAADRPITPRTRAIQVFSWLRSGGEDLNRRVLGTTSQLTAALRGIEAGTENVLALQPICMDLEQIARSAQRHFRIPEARAQQHWAAFIDLALRDGGVCSAKSERLLPQLLGAVAQAVEAAKVMSAVVDARHEQGGR